MYNLLNDYIKELEEIDSIEEYEAFIHKLLQLLKQSMMCKLSRQSLFHILLYDFMLLRCMYTVFLEICKRSATLMTESFKLKMPL